MTKLGHEKQSCEVSSKSNVPVKRYGPGTNFGYACVHCGIDFGYIGEWPWIKAMTHLFAINKLCEEQSKSNFQVKGAYITRKQILVICAVAFILLTLGHDNTCVKYQQVQLTGAVKTYVLVMKFGYL